MRYATLVLSTVVLLGASACATTPPKPPVSVEQVVQMSQSGVPAADIIARMRDSGTVYQLPASQLAKLKAQGVPDEVLDYMQRTYLDYERGRGYYYGGYGYGYGPWWPGPYWGPYPYGYWGPGIYYAPYPRPLYHPWPPRAGHGNWWHRPGQPPPAGGPHALPGGPGRPGTGGTAQGWAGGRGHALSRGGGAAQTPAR